MFTPISSSLNTYSVMSQPGMQSGDSVGIEMISSHRILAGYVSREITCPAVNGKFNGTGFEDFMPPNDSHQLVCIWKDGMKEGEGSISVAVGTSRSVIMKGVFKQDELNGHVEWFSESTGLKVMEGTAKNGKWDGDYVEYDENGHEVHKMFYVDGIPYTGELAESMRKKHQKTDSQLENVKAKDSVEEKEKEKFEQLQKETEKKNDELGWFKVEKAKQEDMISNLEKEKSSLKSSNELKDNTITKERRRCDELESANRSLKDKVDELQSSIREKERWIYNAEKLLEKTYPKLDSIERVCDVWDNARKLKLWLRWSLIFFTGIWFIVTFVSTIMGEVYMTIVMFYYVLLLFLLIHAIFFCAFREPERCIHKNLLLLLFMIFELMGFCFVLFIQLLGISSWYDEAAAMNSYEPAWVVVTTLFLCACVFCNLRCIVWICKTRSALSYVSNNQKAYIDDHPGLKYF